MIVDRLEGQRFIVLFALGLVAREFVVGAAPLLSEGGPVDFCTVDSDGGSDGRGAGVEGFEGPSFEIFGNGLAPVDDGAEDLSGIRLRRSKGSSVGLHRRAALWAGTSGCWCSWLRVLPSSFKRGGLYRTRTLTDIRPKRTSCWIGIAGQQNIRHRECSLRCCDLAIFVCSAASAARHFLAIHYISRLSSFSLNCLKKLLPYQYPARVKQLSFAFTLQG